MSFRKLLIANRGEIAIRIARAAGELGLATVAVYPTDDARRCMSARPTRRTPPRPRRARLSRHRGAIIAAAKATGCDAVHPGYGFLSENAALARRCAEAGIVFVGPSPEALELFGDKAQARRCAKRCGVPIIDGHRRRRPALEEARAFLASLGDGGAMMIKAIAGGGGRGMRVVDEPRSWTRPTHAASPKPRRRSATTPSMSSSCIRNARHIEVQIVGDGTGASAISGSANAPSSAATRSSSRSRRARR